MNVLAIVKVLSHCTVNIEQATGVVIFYYLFVFVKTATNNSHVILTEYLHFPSPQAGLDRCVKACQVSEKLIGLNNKVN